MVRPILQVGDPQLHRPAEPVTDFEDAALQALIEDLIETCLAANGVGLAAPQVGVSRQILILASRPSLRYPSAPLMPPTAVLNPRILAQSADLVWDWEGCLSVPNQRGLVPRRRWVTVSYWDQIGRPQVSHWQDFLARVFQHEYDHLLGQVFLARHPERLLDEASYQREVLGQPLSPTAVPTGNGTPAIPD
ncbi:MAG: peptide deformylase [Gloeomargaritaceae cyanobacterium C42_A2020_066]|nr:peptide deformylase [Gloeomargaritaceae cyanobacterium C42_A2020_066]